MNGTNENRFDTPRGTEEKESAMTGKAAKTPAPDRETLSAKVFRQLFDALMHTQVYHEGFDER